MPPTWSTAEHWAQGVADSPKKDWNFCASFRCCQQQKTTTTITTTFCCCCRLGCVMRMTFSCTTKVSRPLLVFIIPCKKLPMQKGVYRPRHELRYNLFSQALSWHFLRVLFKDPPSSNCIWKLTCSEIAFNSHSQSKLVNYRSSASPSFRTHTFTVCVCGAVGKLYLWLFNVLFSTYFVVNAAENQLSKSCALSTH